VKQTRLESFVESCLNTATGFLVSLTFWTFVVVPVWHLPVTMHQNLVITFWFTVLSVARSYVWRRFFNARIHRAVHKRTRILWKRQN
jgi:hypothetical protein